MTYYDILEISDKASMEVVKMAYKALAKKYHPDTFSGDPQIAEEKMKQINEAYEILTDEYKRKAYDEYLKNEYTNKSENVTHKKEFVFPSKIKSGIIIGILLFVIFSQVLNPYIKMDLGSMALLYGLFDLCLLNIIMMLIPALIGLIRLDLTPKEIKRICVLNSIVLWFGSLFLYLLEVLPAMFLGWIVAVLYYFINKHIMLQILKYDQRRKRSVVCYFILLILHVAIVVGGFVWKNWDSINWDNKIEIDYYDDNGNLVRDDSSTESVEWIKNWRVQYFEEDNQHVLFFGLADKNEIPMSSNGTAIVYIENPRGEILYHEIHDFSTEDFGYWSNLAGEKSYLASIYIDSSKIEKGKYDEGTLCFTILINNDSFEECSTSIYDLPLLPVTIQLPQIPQILHARNYRDEVESSVRIDNVEYVVEDGDSLKIYFSGEKTYDAKGDSYDNSCWFKWKLYDSQNYLIASGTILTKSLSVGDKFKDEYAYVYDGIELGETYTLALYDYN